jgi:hypothetical protein
MRLLTKQLAMRRKAASALVDGEIAVVKKAKTEKALVLCQETIDKVWKRAHTQQRLIGAHISAAGGVHNAIKNCLDIGYTLYL